jgi:hypothetical protein
MTLDDIANNFWVLVPLGLILFIMAWWVSAEYVDPPSDKKKPPGPPPVV